ncbi:phospholipid scramblase 2-like, partial [Dendropsophus ebraccatus]|uniref:phospholipid scramblase 2-like n=1 Tax=Dendropsophus ebraccatus TaxID=150705 RepID=UPI003831DA7C
METLESLKQLTALIQTKRRPSLLNSKQIFGSGIPGLGIMSYTDSVDLWLGEGDGEENEKGRTPIREDVPYTSLQMKGPQDEPPSYNLIAPYAPPDTCTPSAPPSCEIDSALLKGLPPGMEHLLQINQLSVKEKFTVSQGLDSHYDVLNHLGQRLFQADHSVGCCGPIYDVSIKDNGGNEVLHLHEPCDCCSCTRLMEVRSPLGTPIGFVKWYWSNLVTHMSVMNFSKEVVLLILGPSFQDSIFGNNTFEVKSQDEQHVVGMIKTETDQLLVTFPLDLEVTVKALLLGASLYLV